MSNPPNDSLAKRLSYRRRTVMGALAASAGLAGFGRTAAQEGQDTEWLPPEASDVYGALLSDYQTGANTNASGCVHVTPTEEDTLAVDLVVEDIACVTQAHIHEGERGEDGPIVAPLFEFTENPDGTGTGNPLTTRPGMPLIEGTMVEDSELVEDILTNPEEYYVNVHTVHHPGGEVRGQIRGIDHGRDTDLEPQPAEFRVSNLDPQETSVVQGDSFDVSATIHNAGDITETQTVEFRIDGTVEASQDIELGCRESRTVEFEGIGTEDLAIGDHEYTVTTEDDEATGTLTVEEEAEPAEFTVSNLDPVDLTVIQGDTFDISATITNTGGQTGTQTVEYRIDGQIVAARDLELKAGESRTLTFAGIHTGDLDPGEYDHGVFTDDDQQTGSLTVESPPGPPFFTVADLDPRDKTVAQDDTFDVSATIKNVGDETGTQTVEYRVDGEVRAAEELTLDGTDWHVVTFEGIETADLELGQYEHGVFTDDAEMTGTLSVEPDPPVIEFIVRDLEPDELTVIQGDTFDVSATIENVGERTGTQSVRFQIEDQLRINRIIELEPTESRTMTFVGIDTADLEPGTYQFRIATPDDQMTGTLTVEDEPDGEIDSCTVIDEPGEYELTQDIEPDDGDPDTEPCIAIQASDVTLEGNGHVVSGDDAAGDDSVGVQVLHPDHDNLENVTVRNLRVEGWDTGVDIGAGHAGTMLHPAEVHLEDVGAVDNDGRGISISAASGSTFKNITAERNGGPGVTINATTDATFEGINVSENNRYGLYLIDDVGDNEFTDVTATDNGEAGVYMDMSVFGNMFSDLYTANNGGPGIRGDRIGGTIRDATLENNDGPQLSALESSITADELRIGDGAVFTFTEEGLVLDAVDRTELPGLPEDTRAAGDGVEVDGIDERVDVRLEHDEEDAGDQLAVWRHDGDEWAPVADVDPEEPPGTIEIELTEDGLFAPVSVEGEPAVFEVSDLDPEEVTLTQEETLDVSATIENVGEASGTQSIELRVDEEVLEEQEWELDPEESQNVPFEDIEIPDLEPGEYEHGIFSDDDSETGTVIVEGDGPTEIDECTTITEPGEYEIVSDIDAEGDCLQIEVEVRETEITIDGNGHTLEGDGTGRGIFVSDYHQSITLQDITIRNFENGVQTHTPPGGMSTTLESVTVEENTGDGIDFFYLGELTCNGCTIRQNGGAAIRGDEHGQIAVTNCDIHENDGHAISSGISTSVRVVDCEVVGNGGPVSISPVDPENPVDPSKVENTEIRNSAGAGIATIVSDAPQMSEPVPIQNCTIKDNSEAGIQHESSFLEIQDCTITGNKVGYELRDIGVRIEAARLRHNNIEANTDSGARVVNPELLDDPVDAECNYWGHPSGPEHEDNPRENPQGQPVSDHVEFIPWSVQEIQDGDGQCVGGLVEFVVADLDPVDPTIEQGEPLTVSATITNEGEQETAQDIEFRVDDEMLAQEEQTLEAGESETVEFEDIETDHLDPGEYEHGIFSEDDSETGTLTVEEPTEAEFLVSNLDPVDAEVTQGDLIDVSATVENAGEQEETQDIELRIDEALDPEDFVISDEETDPGQFTFWDSQSLTLDAGESETVTFQDVDTGALDPGDYEHGIFSEDDSETGMLTVEADPAEFLVSNFAPRNPTAIQGDTLDISATVENVGAGTDTQTVEYRIDDDVLGSQEMTLAADEAQSAEFALQTADLAPSEYTHGVFTDDDSETGTLTVEAEPDDDPPEDDDPPDDDPPEDDDPPDDDPPDDDDPDGQEEDPDAPDEGEDNEENGESENGEGEENDDEEEND